MSIYGDVYIYSERMDKKELSGASAAQGMPKDSKTDKKFQRIEKLREAHLAMLPENRVEMPFYMGGDHYMLAHGGIGRHKGLVFFIDSGLVLLHPDGQDGIRQVAFSTSRNLLLQWDFAPEAVEKDICESPFSISLGSLAQEGHLMAVGEKSRGPFEDVRIDGLLSHAFLRRYAWTLDSSNFRYIFSRDLGVHHQEMPDGDS